ncbi:hypothetical protein C8F01DRAFT_1295165 [Mycena amicta]|nr:hypothetical protein C8F01DRAFT_1295165 [Mycena amicta]
MPRRIVVDDTDAAIQYNPSTAWFPVANIATLNAQGNFGPVYRNTSHSTTTDGATVRFAFNGTSVALTGSIAVTKLADGTYDPSWECDVDGIKIGESNPTFAFAENNWSLCNQDVISPGAHTLTVTVHSTKGGAFYVDGIFYTPVEEALGLGVDGVVVEYTNLDASGWGAQNVTTTNGAQVALNFHGTEVSLLGYTPQELAHNATSATYSIDGAPPTAFRIAGLPSGTSVTQYNVVLLSLANLTPAAHNLVVTYEGDRNHAPLPVGVFYVTNAVAVTPSESSSGVVWGTASPSATASTTINIAKKTPPTAAIAGGTIGCIALLALIVGALFWCRRRRSRSAPKEEKETQAHPFNPANSSMVGTMGSSILPPFAPSQLYNQQHQNPFNTPVSTPSAVSASAGHGHGYAYAYVPPMSPTSEYGGSSVGGGSNSHSHSQAHSASPSLSLSAVSASSPSSAGVAGLGLPTPPPSESLPSESLPYLHKHTHAALPLPPLPLPPLPGKLEPHRMPRVVLQQHQDSGVRMRTGGPQTVVVEELPPGYSRD